MPTTQIRDTTIYCQSTGTGPALLFIHGMCGDAEVWKGQVDRLADRFTCVTFDRRGHSRSGRGDAPESVETHAADAAALIEALHLPKPVVVGSSGGARIAVELARTRSELISGAVFAEPPLFGIDAAAGEALQQDIVAVVRPAAEAGGARAAVDAFFPLICGRLWATLDEAAKDRYRANGHMMLAEFSGAPYLAGPDAVATITVPSLVLSGTASHPSFQTIARTLAMSLQNARFMQIEGSGHVIYAERPDDFAAAIAAFAHEVATSPTTSATPA